MKRELSFSDSLAQGRARKTAFVLGIVCLAWLVYWPNRELLGAGQPIMGTFYTLVFIASALFLLAGREVLGDAAGVWRNAALWAAPLLFAMYARYWLDKFPGPVHAIAGALVYAIPLFAGVVLLGLSTRPWTAAAEIDQTEAPQGA